MYLAREHTGQTLPGIGRRFGGRNHTTVMHACRRTAERLAADPEAVEIVRGLTERLSGAGHTGGTDRLRGSTAPGCALPPRNERCFPRLCTSPQPL